MALKIMKHYPLNNGLTLMWGTKSNGECDLPQCEERTGDEMFPEPEFNIYIEDQHCESHSPWLMVGSIDDAKALRDLLDFAIAQCEEQTKGRIHYHFFREIGGELQIHHA